MLAHVEKGIREHVARTYRKVARASWCQRYLSRQKYGRNPSKSPLTAGRTTYVLSFFLFLFLFLFRFLAAFFSRIPSTCLLPRSFIFRTMALALFSWLRAALSNELERPLIDPRERRNKKNPRSWIKRNEELCFIVGVPMEGANGDSTNWSPRLNWNSGDRASIEL